MAGEIIFASSRAAVAWAEERSQRPDMDSQLTRYAKGAGGGSLTPSDLRDIALTITSLTQAFDPPTGSAFLAVYGGDRRLTRAAAPARWMAEQILATDRIGESGRTGPKPLRQGQTIALCIGLVEAERRSFWSNKAMPRDELARWAGVERNQFRRNGWPDVTTNARRLLWSMLRRAELHLDHELASRGWL